MWFIVYRYNVQNERGGWELIPWGIDDAPFVSKEEATDYIDNQFDHPEDHEIYVAEGTEIVKC